MNPQQLSTRSTGLALVLWTAIAAPVWATSHQGGQGAQSDQVKTAATEPAQANPGELTDGEVRKVDKDAGKLTIRHATIKSLDMPPMTMSFHVSNARLLDHLAVGDRVRFTAERIAGQYTLTSVSKAP